MTVNAPTKTQTKYSRTWL